MNEDILFCFKGVEDVPDISGQPVCPDWHFDFYMRRVISELHGPQG